MRLSVRSGCCNLAHIRFLMELVSLPFTERRVAVSALVGEVSSLGRFGFECLLLTTVGAVAIQPSFVAVQQVA